MIGWITWSATWNLPKLYAGLIILIEGTDVHRLHTRNGLPCLLSQVVHLKFYLRLCLKVFVNKNYILF
jgi:hypothetical protein